MPIADFQLPIETPLAILFAIDNRKPAIEDSGWLHSQSNVPSITSI
jgi:hypothetical protein